MNKDKILKSLNSQKTKDYTYLIGFFLTFSFFLFFVIRPNVLSVFKAMTKIDELTTVNDFYESQINKVIEIQTVFESHRDDLILLKEAISENPQVNKMLSDTNKAALENNVQIDKINIADINLKDKSNRDKIKSINLNMQLSGDFENMMTFLKTIREQRRLKVIKNLNIGRGDKVSSESSKLMMTVEVEGYYL